MEIAVRNFDQGIPRQLQRWLALRLNMPALVNQIFEGHAQVVGGQVGIAAHESPQALGMLTICVLVLRNGFTVTGESACASPENFNADIGRQVARANAINKIWPLMGYELRSKLGALKP